MCNHVFMLLPTNILISRECNHTFTHTLTHLHTLPHTLIHTLTPSHPHTHSHTLIHILTHSPTHPHTYSHTLTGMLVDMLVHQWPRVRKVFTHKNKTKWSKIPSPFNTSHTHWLCALLHFVFVFVLLFSL